MRDNETRNAILAGLIGIAILAVAIGGFVAFRGGDDAPEEPRQRRQVSLPFPPRPTEPPPPRCYDPDDCIQPSVELSTAYSDPRACDGRGPRVCLFPLGDVPPALVRHLADYYAQEYGLTLHVLPPVKLEAGLDTGGLQRSGQVEAQLLKNAYTVKYPAYSLDRNVLLIGLTPIDIYTATRPEWRWFFGELASRHAVISIYRMDPVTWQDPPDNDVLFRRVRTLMNKYIALDYYGLPLNDDPSSVTFRQISSVDALDRIDERIPVPR